MRSPLPVENEVHVWYVRVPSPLADRLEQQMHLLNPAEIVRYNRFAVEEPRRQFARTRAFIRLLLSSYDAGKPEAWEFAEGEKGKPRVTNFPGMHFNLSHTSGLIVCAVAAREEIGVDVEDAHRVAEYRSVAKHSFAESEIAALAPLSGDELRNRFYYVWTLKEAYIKARGLGFSMGLADFSFAPFAPGEPKVRFEPSLADNAAAWRFAHLTPVAGHLIGVALKASAPLSITTREFDY